MTRLFVLLSLAALAACGADGAPFVPSASLGANIGPGGIAPSAAVGATNGTISVGLAL